MIKFISQDRTVFGQTPILAIGKRQPKIVYGEKAKELREKSGMDQVELSKKLSVKLEKIQKIEETKAAMDETVMERYCKEFNVEKEYFFDLDLNTYIIAENGIALKNFETSEECKKAYEGYIEEWLKNNDLFIDFSK